MDFVAKGLGISKRTLYELYGSKEEMIRDVLIFYHNEQKKFIERRLASTTNAMESMAVALMAHQATMQTVNIDLIRDLDSKYHHLRPDFDKCHDQIKTLLINAFEKGRMQGVFRNDVDYSIIIRLFLIQVESLKRMEEFFPPDVTLAQASLHVSLGMLRSIATPKGMDIVEKVYSDYKLNPDKYQQYEIP